MKPTKTIAIIGAGAAGCFAAANIIWKEGVEVAVFEKTGKAMQKVKASGGGRCNVTNECFDIPELVKRYPRGQQLLKKTLHLFGPPQTMNWFEQRGVHLKTEADGRMFPITDDSQTIIDCVWKEMMQQKVQVYYHKAVASIEKRETKWEISFTDGSEYEADKVLITTGGFAKTEQYQWIRRLGHTIQPPVPSLFTFNMPRHPITALMGVSVPDVTIRIAGTKLQQSGALLITHWGLSGPAVLKLSAIAARELADKKYDFTVSVNWTSANDADITELFARTRRESGKQTVFHKNPTLLPRRLWEYQLAKCAITETVRWGELNATAQKKLVECLVRDAYPVTGKTTFREEFVTCGGVTLNEIHPQSMESRVAPGIFFAGEILDVDGITGGFNFQHAWSSAWIAAQNISGTGIQPIDKK